MTDRYYYYQLNDACRVLYVRILEEIKQRHINIICADLIIDKENVSTVINAVMCDNPHLFYVNFFNYKYYEEFDKVVNIQISYLYTLDDTEALQLIVDRSLLKLTDKLDLGDCSDLQKVWKLHDFLIDNVEYFQEALLNTGSFEWCRAQSILGLMLDKKAVCSGISMAFKYILNRIGVRSIVVLGTALNKNDLKERHAWNIVKIAGVSYHIDMTWDITSSQKGLRNYDYFILTDQLIFKDHYTDAVLPACHSDRDNYFVRNGWVIRNSQDWKRYFAECNAHSIGDYYVRIDYPCQLEQATSRIINYNIMANMGVQFSYRTFLNPRQGIIRVKIEYGKF